jgi:hypothetical protein
MLFEKKYPLRDKIRDDFGGGGGGGGAPAPDSIEVRLNYLVDKKKRLASPPLRLMALVFGQPSNETFQKQIAPSLDYWHYRSGKRLDILCVGYGDNAAEFDAKLFASSIQWMQSRSAFEYSGGTDLVVVNTHVDQKSGWLSLDTSCVVAVAVDEAIADGAIKSAQNFMERVFTFVEKQKSDDPTWGFSDAQGGKIAGSGLKALLISCLPKSLQKDAKAAFHLRVREYRKSA